MKLQSMFGDDRFDDVLGSEISDSTRVSHAVHRTPMAIVRQIVQRLEPLLGDAPSRILLPAAGDGRFGWVCRVMWPDAHLTAVEPREEEAEGLRRFCDEVVVGYIQDVTGSLGVYDLIIDNPPFSLILPGTQKKSQSEALSAFVPLRALLRESTARLVLYWTSDLGQRSPASVALMEEHCPIEQWRIPLPVSHDRKVDVRSYSVWHWDNFTGNRAPEWRTSTMPIVEDRDTYSGDFVIS